ncbi:hypothetical protein GQ44DRAFT_197574 [Phaeosphaeriaceae sp. PMI808]|nr:hypothetical protein GQ44DRAFT_197574 [Phaeosphaeriaceae sp. PMI808]
MGSQAEAWIMVGRAIRLGQDIGLHRSPKWRRLPPNQCENRRLVWWRLYLLDRHLG